MKNIKFIWTVSLIVKLILGALIPLSLDESYYWTWAKNFQLSYFDHPPFIAWLFWIAQPLDTFFQSVRWPGIIMGHFTFVIWYFILKNDFSEKQLFWFFLIALFAPFTGLGSMALTPDLPLLFFWSLSLLFFKRALSDQSTFNFSILGTTLGLAFCSKYHAFLFLPFAILYLVIIKKMNFQILKKMSLGFLLFFIFSSPVWVWNIQNDFISFKFQLGHGLNQSGWTINWMLSYLGAQILLIFPTLFLIFIRSKKMPQNIDFIRFFAWAGFVFFFLTSLKGRTEANWTSFSFLPLFAVVAYNFKSIKTLTVTVSFWAILSFLVIYEIISPTISKNFDKLKTNEFSKFNSLIKEIPQFHHSSVPLYARTYQMASKLSFELKRSISKLKGMNRLDYYDFRKNSMPNTEVFSVIFEPYDLTPKWVVESGYKEISRKSLAKKYQLVTFKK